MSMMQIMYMFIIDLELIKSFKNIELYDDGLHNDGLAGDGVFGGKISNCSNSIEYYFYAENDSAGSFSPERAAYEFYTARF